MKGLGKRILVMAAVTAVCVWAAGKSSYAVKPYRLDEDTLAQQVQAFVEQDPTEFNSRTIYDGIVIGNRAFYVFTQQAGYVIMKDGVQWDCFFGDLHASPNWLGEWTVEVGSYATNEKFIYEVIGCGGHNFLLLYGLNFDQPVARVTFDWYGKAYELQSDSENPCFLLCTELGDALPSESMADDMIALGNFRFYTKTGEEITNRYDRYGGTIDRSDITVVGSIGTIYKEA